jgi:hypothetical protein
MVKHLIFATGFGGGFPKTPDVPGKVGPLCVLSFRDGSKSPFSWSGIVPWFHSPFHPVHFCNGLWWEEGDRRWCLQFRFGAPPLMILGECSGLHSP